MSARFDSVREFGAGNTRLRAYFDSIEEGYEYAEYKRYQVIGHNTTAALGKGTLGDWQFHYLNISLKELYGYQK